MQGSWNQSNWMDDLTIYWISSRTIFEMENLKILYMLIKFKMLY